MKIQYSGHPTVPLAGQQEPLTDDQKQILQEILSRYKPENFSSKDQTALRQEMKEAGIPRTMETERMIRDNGLYSRQPSDSRRIPDYGNHYDDSLMTPQIISLFKMHNTGELTDQEFHAQLEQVKQNFQKSSGNLINKPA